MLRLVAFFVVAFVLARFLSHVPLIGGFFRYTGIFGVWITAMLLSFGITKYGQRAVLMQRDAARVRELSTVDTPTNQGKLGTLLLARGRTRKALAPLQAAVLGEPEVPEWHYRLGCAHLALHDLEAAVTSLERSVELEEEYAYGGAQLRLAEALMEAKRNEEALAVLTIFERNHGPSPESAYRRGLAHKLAGERDEARSAFDEVAGLARQAARYQRTSAGMWSMKARLASMF